MNPTNWDLKPSKVIMHPDDYRDIVVYGLVADGWSHRAARVEADRRIQVLQEEYEAESNLVQQLHDIGEGLSNPAPTTFRGTLLQGAFEGTFPPGSSASDLDAFYSRDGCPPQMLRAFELGCIARERKLTQGEHIEWESLRES